MVAAVRFFNRPEFSGRHDFQAEKFERQCTKSGSHAVGLQEKSSKNLMQNNTYYICVTYAPPTNIGRGFYALQPC